MPEIPEIPIQIPDILVAICIDFGTTYSGYAYAHKNTPKEIVATDDWQGSMGFFKVPTVIKYRDASYTDVETWGYPALIEKPRRNATSTPSKPVIELFKLHLFGEALEEKDKPFLPNGLDFRNVIKDYLKKLSETIEESLKSTWPDFDFERALFILTVPAEFDENAVDTLRNCAIDAGLIKKDGLNLMFMTEPEAAAIYCLNFTIKEESKLKPGDSFMVVDCGGGTVDLTTRELLEGMKLGEITERKGYHCGSSFVDKAFLDFIGEKVGDSVIEGMKRDHYGQLQYIVQEFCKFAKFPFTGVKEEFFDYECDLDNVKKAMGKYLKGEKLRLMEESDWLIEINFEQIKAMFDPIIDKILDLIQEQFDQNQKKCSVMFLVGGFSGSKYLQARIKNKFTEIKVTVPSHPEKSVSHGGVLYGLNSIVVDGHILRKTYGTDVVRRWLPNDPPSLNGLTKVFQTLLTRGTRILKDTKVVRKFKAYSSSQRVVGFDIYSSPEKNVKFCNETGVKLVGIMEIHIPEDDDLIGDIFTLTLTFDTVKLLYVTVENERTKEKCQVEFKLE